LWERIPIRDKSRKGYLSHILHSEIADIVAHNPSDIILIDFSPAPLHNTRMKPHLGPACRLGSALICLACLLIPLSAFGQADYGLRHDPDAPWTGRAGGALLGEIAAVGAVSLATFAVGAAMHVDWMSESSYGIGFIGMASLIPAIPAGCAAGACLVGRAQEQVGNYWASYLGGLAGMPVGLLLAYGALYARNQVLQIPLFVAAAVAPAIGATVGYDLTSTGPNYEGFHNARIYPPSLAVFTERDKTHGRSVGMDLRVISLRF
jgi:hypothetical protein